MKFIVMLLAMFSTLTLAKPITLTTTNHVALTGVIDDNNIKGVISRLGSHKYKTVYLYINSSGGSVYAGMRLVRFLKSTNKRVVCLATNAGSMAFVIFQYCKWRIIEDGGELFHHLISTDFPRMSVDKYESTLKSLLDLQEIVLRDQAKRFNITYEKYYSRIVSDVYVDSSNALAENMADKVETIKCSYKLFHKENKVEKVGGFTAIVLGTNKVEVETGGCPLYSDPSGGAYVPNPESKTPKYDIKWISPMH